MPTYWMLMVLWGFLGMSSILLFLSPWFLSAFHSNWRYGILYYKRVWNIQWGYWLFVLIAFAELRCCSFSCSECLFSSVCVCNSYFLSSVQWIDLIVHIWIYIFNIFIRDFAIVSIICCTVANDETTADNRVYPQNHVDIYMYIYNYTYVDFI